MTEFKIRRGLSTQLFSEPGKLNPQVKVEVGCWYLCTDTADLFLGIEETEGVLGLKRINEAVSVEADFDVKAAIEELQSSLIAIEDVQLFKKITSLDELPKNFEDELFNPNITYFIELADNRIVTYVFDISTKKYLCTNNIDDSVVNAMVAAAIELVLDNKLDTVLEEKVKQTIEAVILYGGDATPED